MIIFLQVGAALAALGQSVTEPVSEEMGSLKLYVRWQPTVELQVRERHTSLSPQGQKSHSPRAASSSTRVSPRTETLLPDECAALKEADWRMNWRKKRPPAELQITLSLPEGADRCPDLVKG